MKKPRKSRSLVIFYLLVTYILIQFGWWAFMLMDLNKEVYQLKAEVATLQGLPEMAAEIQSKASGRMYMIFGEGIVFLVILALGILQIRRSYRKEMALAQQQQNFLMSVTHELKSPIASVKLWLQTLQRRNLPEEQREEILHKTVKDTDRLHYLVENILTATRIENSNMPIAREQTDLSALISDVINNAKETIGKQHPTTLKIEPNIGMEADRNAINSIVINLYENAVKYAPNGSKILVELKKVGENICLCVADEGRGINPKDEERIFEKFYRAGDEATRTTKGTGLGLHIVKKLVQLHEGTVKTSPNTPKGAIFEVIFKAT